MILKKGGSNEEKTMERRWCGKSTFLECAFTLGVTFIMK